MQVFEKMQHGRALACVLTFACALLAVGLASTAQAQTAGAHAATGVSGKKAELGASVAVDASGNFWMVSKEADAAGQQYVVLQHSNDGGRSWSAPRRLQGEAEAVSADGENRPKLVFGKQGDMYVSYTRPLAKPYTGEIRFMRSLDGGKTFSAPQTVHANRDLITHRFESMIVDESGRIYIAWIDKRDLEATLARKESYTGAAIYYAVSENRGESFKGDYKLADHSCECCRIAMALTPDGRVAAMWRHVFAPNVRDHAMAFLAPDGKTRPATRETYDDWRIDACPHHGPAIAYAQDGTRHQVWFNVKDGEGGVFHARVSPRGVIATPMRLGSAQAAHGDVAIHGKRVVLVWKQFDGKQTAIFSKVSIDDGQTWREHELARTSQASDQPRLVKTPFGIVLAWRTQQEGMRILPVALPVEK